MDGDGMKTTTQAAEARITELESMLAAISRVPVGPDAARIICNIIAGKWEIPAAELERNDAILHARNLERRMALAEPTLRFYAAESNYHDLPDGDNTMLSDGGKQARAALHTMAGWGAGVTEGARS